MNRICFATLIALTAFTAVTACTPDAGPAKLAAPAPVLASAGIDNATFMWEAVKNAASYHVVVNDGAPLAAEGVSITIQNLSASTTYTLKMKALAPEGSKEWVDSDYCDPVSFTTAGKKKLATPVLTVSDVVSGGFTVSWNAVKNAVSYVYKVGDAAEQSTTATRFTADGLSHSTTYSVKVKAVPSEAMADVAVDSDWAETSATTAGVSTLDVPVLSASAIHTNGFTISWPAVANAGKYNYKLDGGAEMTVTEPSVSITSLPALSTHTVEVRSAPSDANINNYAPSAWASIQVKTLDLVALDAPVLKAENVLDTEFTVSWAAVPHAGGYMCSLNGAAYTLVSGTSVKYEGLTAVTTYNVKVYAVPTEAGRATYKDSAVSSKDVTTKQAASEDDKGGSLGDFNEQPIL